MELENIKHYASIDFDRSEFVGRLGFKHFRDIYLDVAGEYSLEDLDKVFQEYCAKYFILFGSLYDGERKEINSAYHCLRGIKEGNKKKEVYFHSCKELLDSYQKLIHTLENYKFRTCCDGVYSNGEKQNQTNEKILYDISLLNQFLIDVVKKIDDYIMWSDYEENESEFCEVLLAKVDALKQKLDHSEDCLNGAEVAYHETWTAHNRPRISSIGYCTSDELGDARKTWRLMRNNACHTILEMYKELADINIALAYHTFGYENMDANVGVDDDTAMLGEIYNCGIRNIINGPHYFSYLDEEQKAEIAEEKVFKKIQDRKSGSKK